MVAEPNAVQVVQGSAGTGTFATAGAAIKAFVLANSVSLAGVAGIIIGVVGYRLLHHTHTPALEEETLETGSEEGAAS